MGLMVDSLSFRVPVAFPMGRSLLNDVMGIDRTSQRSLLNFRTLSEGRKHVPHVPFSIPFGQYVMQLGHCVLGSDLASLEVLHVSHAADHVLRLLAERIERAILLWCLLWCFFVQGDSRTDESISGLPFCGCDRVLGQPNGAILGS